MALEWAQRMRLLIIGLVSAVVLVLVGSVVLAFVYQVPSCTDRKQNQGEAGIDCGSPCAYLCTASVSAPVEVFTRTLTLSSGRTDVISYVQNPNKDAEARAVGYTIELYAADAMRVAKITGTVDLPVGAVVPIYVRAAAQGSIVSRAFITFSPESIQWRSVQKAQKLPRVIETALSQSAFPRVTAQLINDTFDPMYSVRAVAVVYDAEGTVLAASETLVPAIAAQGSAPLVFTWNEPFPRPAAQIEITPVLPLL